MEASGGARPPALLQVGRSKPVFHSVFPPFMHLGCTQEEVVTLYQFAGTVCLT